MTESSTTPPSSDDPRVEALQAVYDRVNSWQESSTPEQIRAELAKYPNAADLVWVQEEPANMGAWQFMAVNLPEHLPQGRTLRVSQASVAPPRLSTAPPNCALSSGLTPISSVCRAITCAAPRVLR